jgi:N-methylhydantoinase B
LIDQYSLNMIDAAAEALFNHSESLMRDAIRKLPDGEYSAISYIDG